MAQAQLMFTEESLQLLNGFESAQWHPTLKKIVCCFGEYTINLKLKRKRLYVHLKKHLYIIRLELAQFLSLCDLKESVLSLASFLENHHS